MAKFRKYYDVNNRVVEFNEEHIEKIEHRGKDGRVVTTIRGSISRVSKTKSKDKKQQEEK